jgi:hypothetical protein
LCTLKTRLLFDQRVRMFALKTGPDIAPPVGANESLGVGPHEALPLAIESVGMEIGHAMESGLLRRPPAQRSHARLARVRASDDSGMVQRVAAKDGLSRGLTS